MSVRGSRRRDWLLKFFNSNKNHEPNENVEAFGETTPSCPKADPLSNLPSPDSNLVSSSDVDVPKDQLAKDITASTENDRHYMSQTEDLWILAWDRLDDQSRAILNSTSESLGVGSLSARQAIEKVKDQTEAAYSSYLRKGPTVKIRRGTEINIRTQAKKILSSTIAFKSCIDAVAGSDPSGHASAAWAIVSFALTLAANDQDRIDDIMESSAFLATMLSRYKSIETSYFSRSFEKSDQLKAAIIDVYTAILEYSAAVKRANQEGSIRRVLATFEALSGQPFRALKGAIDAKDEKVEMWRRLIGDQYRFSEFEETDKKADAILKKLDQVASDLAAVKKAFLTSEKKALLEWTSSVDVSTSYNRSLALREPGTGKWFVTSEAFRIWKETPSSLMWLYGTSKTCSKRFD